ncbi:glycosyltransferase [Corynebacterium falsenii]|uniref:glycosyltransferase n=1 Tax=Corynebacterium falsenii TaxID=108486 RepID=UPI001DFADF58|nr:glycosyltransferase [Corynebacterium falsenii]HJF12328.1 glycosyltransferase [Corynebacterium falsenii]
MTVLSIPAGHPYVQSVAPREPKSSIGLLRDPVIDPTNPTRWWPHPGLDASWWRAETPDTPSEVKDSISVVHVHFGYEHLSVTETAAFLEALRDRRTPLVLTVHDIDNPHLLDQRAYHQQLRLLLADAARIITLTDHAQQRLTGEFGVPAHRITVLPHPQVVPDAHPALARANDPDRRWDVAVFLKSMRTNVVADPRFYQDIAEECAAAGMTCAVFVHRDQADSSFVRRLNAQLPSAARVVVHDPMADDELFFTIAQCTAVILPYQVGTHSGWLEMCRDLGARVAAPECGSYADQADDPAAVASYPTADGTAAGRAAVSLAALGPLAYQGDRTAQRDATEDFHRSTYQQLSRPTFNVAFIAPARFPIAQPYAGGLEAFCATTVQALRQRGHRVDLYAAAGSEGNNKTVEFPGVDWTGHAHIREDHTYPPGERAKEDAAFKRLRTHLEREVASGRIDVIHNNSLHPELFGSALSARMITTLHTPALDDVQAAIDASANPGSFAAVSQATADSWRLPSPAHIVHNSFDENVWQFGEGSEGAPRAVWFGRITPEKGPHMAIDAARRMGLDITLVGRISNPRYFGQAIQPRLGDGVTLHSECTQPQLNEVVRTSSLCFVTPQWEEPFGLVVIEAMGSGTPVAAIHRGGVGEVLHDYPQLLAEPEDGLEGLVRAAHNALATDRRDVADWARSNYSNHRLAQRYTQLYREVSGGAR